MRGIRSMVVAVVVGALVAAAGAAPTAATAPPYLGLQGTIWVGDRVSPTSGAELVGFAASSGDVRFEVDLDAPASDVAAAAGKVFVGEESLARIAVIDGQTGAVLGRIATGPLPHHLTTSADGSMVAYSAFGSNRVGVIDAATATLVGEWAATDDPTDRAHGVAFSPDGGTLYVASEGVGTVSALAVPSGRPIATLNVPGAHELLPSPDGRQLYVSSRPLDLLRVIDLATWSVTASIPMGRPDTITVSANGKMLTVGLRTMPASVAVVNAETFAVTETIQVAGPGTLAGHQWTSSNRRYTFVAFEGPGAGLAVIDHRTGAVTQHPYPGGGRPHGLDYAPPLSD
jgi:YVTN family beta-propeller protein